MAAVSTADYGAPSRRLPGPIRTADRRPGMSNGRESLSQVDRESWVEIIPGDTPGASD